MSHYHVDERDMMFNLKECPGMADLDGLEGFADTSEDTMQMVFDQSRGFCEKVLAPLLQSSDRESCRLENGQVILPAGIAEAWEQYRAMGFVGMNSSSEHGGADLPHFFCLPVEEMECGSFVSFSMLPLLTRGAARLILAFGSEAHKQLYVDRMFSGEWTGTMCLTEPGAGSDVGAGITRAQPEGDHYKISGTKIFISWGDHGLVDNIIHLVLARLPDGPPGSKGLSLFIVPKHLSDQNGKITKFNDVECGNIEHKMGIKASPTCVINFGTNNGCVGYLLGEAHQGIRYMFQMMNEARIEVAVQGMAQASAAYQSACRYAADRTQGSAGHGKNSRPAKIIEHPDVRRMLLKSRALVEAMRSMLYHVALYMDGAHHGHKNAKKFTALIELLTPICKSYCSDQGFRVAEMAVQTYGGYGYVQDYPVEQYMRDLKISSIYEGTNGIQALDLVFRKILMNKGESLGVWFRDVQELCQELKGTALEGSARGLLDGAQAVVDTAGWFGKTMAGGGEDLVKFHATDFQEHAGHVVAGYFLMRQGKAAMSALEKGPGSESDRRFYEQKLVTLAYFIETIVPVSVSALAIMCRDNPGLQAQFEIPGGG